MIRTLSLAALFSTAYSLASLAADAAPTWDRGSATANELAGYQCAAAIGINLYGANNKFNKYGEVVSALDWGSRTALAVAVQETARRTGSESSIKKVEVEKIILGEAKRLKERWATDRNGVLQKSQECILWSDNVGLQMKANPSMSSKDIIPPADMVRQKIDHDIVKTMNELAAYSFSIWKPPAANH